MKLSSFYLFTLIVIFAPLLGKLLKSSYDLYNLYKQYNKGSKLVDLLNRITPREFEIWASEHLSSLGYTNIVLSPLYQSENNSILCAKSFQPYLVQCKRKSHSLSITKSDIDELLGVLISSNVTNGILVTTNNIGNEVYSSIDNLKSPYKIKVISLYNENIYYKDYLLQSNN